MLSHHGSEHFCTLSLLRLLGISIVDEFEHDEDVLQVATLPPQTTPVVPASVATPVEAFQTPLPRVIHVPPTANEERRVVQETQNRTQNNRTGATLVHTVTEVVMMTAKGVLNKAASVIDTIRSHTGRKSPFDEEHAMICARAGNRSVPWLTFNAV